MAENPLQQQLRQGAIGRILESINNVETFIKRQDIKFPRIAVFGDESTGKSSLMEAICGVPFPKGKTVTTKAATQIRLRKTSDPWSATAWTAGQFSAPRRNEQSVQSPDDLGQVISDLQSKEIKFSNRNTRPENVSEFAAEPITIEIRSPDVEDLTLIDLPGYITNTSLDHSKLGAEDVKRVRQTLEDYLEDESTVLLVVAKANANLRNANIINLLTDHVRILDTEDNLRSFKARTIYCFTMCDLVGDEPNQQRPPQDIETVLRNSGDFRALPHGWYAVINNLSGSENSAERLKLDREAEAEYFKKNSPYNKPGLEHRCGIANLLGKLSSVLTEEISKHLPSMLIESEKALTLAESRFKELDLYPSNKRNLNDEYHYIVSHIKKYFEQAGNGNYGWIRREAEKLPRNISKETLLKVELGRLRKERFANFKRDIIACRLELKSDAYKKELLRREAAASDGKMDDVLRNKEVVMHEARECADAWRVCAKQMCNDIANITIACLNLIIKIRAGESTYQRLPSVLREFMKNMIEEQKEKAQIRLEWLWVDEVLRPNTVLNRFAEEYKKKSALGLTSDNKKNSDTFKAALEAYLPIAEERYLDTAIRMVTTHLNDVPLGDQITLVPIDEQPKYVFSESAIRGEHQLPELLALREDLEKARDEEAVKIEELKKLRSALLELPPPSFVVVDAEPNSALVNGAPEE